MIELPLPAGVDRQLIQTPRRRVPALRGLPRPEADNGTEVVMVSGFFGTKEDYRELLSLLAEAGFRGWAYDYSGQLDLAQHETGYTIAADGRRPGGGDPRGHLGTPGAPHRALPGRFRGPVRRARRARSGPQPDPAGLRPEHGREQAPGHAQTGWLSCTRTAARSRCGRWSRCCSPRTTRSCGSSGTPSWPR